MTWLYISLVVVVVVLWFCNKKRLAIKIAREAAKLTPTKIDDELVDLIDEDK